MGDAMDEERDHLCDSVSGLLGAGALTKGTPGTRTRNGQSTTR